MLSFFHQSYPLDDSPSLRIRGVIAYGLFVGLFLFVFRPFGLYEAPLKLLFQLSLIYGLVTSSLMAIHSFLLYPLYSEEGWTVGKEILRILVIVLSIAMCNWLIGWFFMFTDISWASAFRWFFYTLVIGVGPISFGIFLNHNRLLRRHVNSLKELKQQEVTVVQKAQKESSFLAIQSENGQEVLRLDAESLRYIKSADNYVEVVYHQKGRRQKELIRTSLKQITTQAQEAAWWMRCHNSYLLNLQKVAEVKGNAQGYKVLLEGEEQPVPVSRKYLKTFGERLNHSS
ncbi:MAG: LytTR family DNA-binding domain-containing protein [Bacteroidota bacterium]